MTAVRGDVISDVDDFAVLGGGSAYINRLRLAVIHFGFVAHGYSANNGFGYLPIINRIESAFDGIIRIVHRNNFGSVKTGVNSGMVKLAPVFEFAGVKHDNQRFIARFKIGNNGFHAFFGAIIRIRRSRNPNYGNGLGQYLPFNAAVVSYGIISSRSLVVKTGNGGIIPRVDIAVIDISQA